MNLKWKSSTSWNGQPIKGYKGNGGDSPGLGVPWCLIFTDFQTAPSVTWTSWTDASSGFEWLWMVADLLWGDQHAAHLNALLHITPGSQQVRSDPPWPRCGLRSWSQASKAFGLAKLRREHTADDLNILKHDIAFELCNVEHIYFDLSWSVIADIAWYCRKHAKNCNKMSIGIH